VLSTSTVRPFIVSMISPGLVAWPLGMFSVRGVTTDRLMGKPSLATAHAAATTAAAPPISARISFMLAPGLMLMPPESKVIPLPTYARVGASLLPAAVAPV